MRAFLILALFSLTLAGCGQKGALYLPQDGSEQTTAQPSSK